MPQNTDEFKQWAWEQLAIDLEKEHVMSIDIHIEYSSLPTVTVKRYVEDEEVITTLPLKLDAYN